jgi:signal transduction histidine kinase
MEIETETESLRRLIDIGGHLLSELDPDAVLQRLLEEARQITGARYAALGVLGEDRTELARFLTVGIDAEGQRVIGDLPRGRGVLGVLIADARLLRLSDVGAHPQSSGFPAGHPPMRTFLGVPIIIRGEAWGNLYLTEKADGAEFSQADEGAVRILAQFAGTAIENARLYDLAERGRQDLGRAVRGLEAARAIADAISAESELEPILELVVERGRDLVGARSVLIMLCEQEDLQVAAAAGTTAAAVGRRIPIAASTAGEVLLRGTPERVADVNRNLRIAPENLGVNDAQTALLVPMSYRGDAVGVLVAFDRGPDRAPFSAADEELLRTFAASAANAVAISRSVEADRLRIAVNSAEDERRRWARELHDQTLQSIGSVRVLLTSASSHAGEHALREAVDQAVEDLDYEIANLRGIISDLRPSILDDLGLVAALEALIERRRGDGLEIRVDLRLPGQADAPGLMSPELETTVYRLVQEALTNVVKHSGAERAWVTVALSGGVAIVNVRDDGVGFDDAGASSGFGLTGIRERVYLAGGDATLASDPGGTELKARIPAGPGAPLGVFRDAAD